MMVMEDILARERRSEFDLIRAVSTVIIVLFHYSYSFVQYGVGGDHVYFMMHANGTWGAIFVALFFMLSGASLYYNWRDRLTSVRGRGGVLDFYKRRWLAIFPMFYIGWFIFYIMYVISFDGLFNWGGEYRKLLLTLLGLDGYFLYRGINYYTIGEWFLGAIIMLYILYPLLQYVMNKMPFIGTAIVFLLFGINVARHMIPFLASYNARIVISDNINIITCLLPFWVGMLLVRVDKNKLIKPYIVIPAILVTLVLTVIPLPISTLIAGPILSACFFIMLSALSTVLDKVDNKGFKKIYGGSVGFFSKYSYPIFLVHHVLIQKAMSCFEGKSFNYPASVGFFLLLLLIISLCAVLLSKISGKVVAIIGGFFSEKQPA